ncbi:MAG: response regulator [Nitrospirae bacterium]|nr:response regulator [Nitrospirota bacterium]
MDAIEVLLVDDEPDYAETMAFWLKAKGYRVTTAADGHEALAKLSERLPRIVFLDIMMPGMDGIETLRRIRRSHGALPVIMVTAYASDERMGEAEQLGAVGFFQKAADFSVAARLIDRALHDLKQRKAAS